MITPDQHPNLSGKSTSTGLGVARGHLLKEETGLGSGRSPVGEEPACEELPMRTVHQSTQPTFPAGDHHRSELGSLTTTWGPGHSRKPQGFFPASSSALSQSCLQHLSLVMSKTWVTGLVQGVAGRPLPLLTGLHLLGALPIFLGSGLMPGGTWLRPGCRGTLAETAGT